MKDTIRIYHYSNHDIKEKSLCIDFFGLNSFTSNSEKLSSIKRIYFYTKAIPAEYYFKNCQYCYIAEVKQSKIYNLTIDKKNLIKKERSLHSVLYRVKKLGYSGVSYTIGNYECISLFYDVKIKNKRIL